MIPSFPENMENGCLLSLQELQGSHPAAAYLRACCVFLSCVPEVTSSQTPLDADFDPAASGTPVPVPVVVDASGMGSARTSGCVEILCGPAVRSMYVQAVQLRGLCPRMAHYGYGAS